MIRSVITGYGDLGRSVEKAIADQPDVEFTGAFSRHDSLDTETRVLPAADVEKYKDGIDMPFVYLSSVTGIPEQAPDLAENLTTVDTYDNHHEIPRHHMVMEAVVREGNNIITISTGWGLGLFFLSRVLGAAILPGANQMTFQEPGLSQGHSDAVRRVPEMEKGVQYTEPDPEAIKAVKRDEGADLKGNECHLRHYFVVAEKTDNADKDAKLREQIRETIVTMPDYFASYETIVDSISEEKFNRNHQGMPHGGQVITRNRIGTSGHIIEFGLDLDHNPDFTIAVRVAYGCAACRLKQTGESGARTVFGIASYLLPAEPPDDLVAQKL